MKPFLLVIGSLITLSALPALAWGDVCKDSEKKFHNEYSTMNMCKREGCNSYLHAAETSKALQRGRDAGCPWAFR